MVEDGAVGSRLGAAEACGLTGAEQQQRRRPQMGVPLSIGLIYIANTAQGTNMVICRALKPKRAEGRKKQPGKKSLSKRDLF